MEVLGRWRCGSCGAWNGEESETSKVLANIRSQSAEGRPALKTEEMDHSSVDDTTDDAVMVADSDGEQSEADADSEVKPEPEEPKVSEPEEHPEPDRRTTRSRSKASKKKG